MINYIDKYGRWHIKPVIEENPLPTNNAYLYTFYANMVNLETEIKGDAFTDINQIQYKVLNRHPNIVPPEGVPISYDEYVGVAGLNSNYAWHICSYGENNYWQFCDIPGFKPTPFRKLNIHNVVSSYEDLLHEENPRTAVIKYPDIYPLAFWHRPEEQYFYYRCANKSPGAFRTIYFILATIISILSKDQSSPMLGFKFVKLKKLGCTKIEKMLLWFFNKKVDWVKTCEQYFPKDHPILQKVIDLYSKSIYTGEGI